MDARGYTEVNMIDEVERSNMKELTELTLLADRVLTF